MAELIGAITFFYLFIMLLSVVFAYLFRFDVWLQGILIIVFIFTFAVFIPHTYQMFQLENGIPADRDVVGNGGLDVNSFVLSTQLDIVDSDSFYVNNYDVDFFKDARYDTSKFCAFFNNSDLGNNYVRVVNGESVISGKLYIHRSSSGVSCVDFNSSEVVGGALLGLVCGDCSAGNVLSVARVDLVEDLEIVINSSDFSYSINEEKPLFSYLDLRDVPEDSVKQTWNLYMVLLGFIVLMFIMRLLIVFMETFRKVVT